MRVCVCVHYGGGGEGGLLRAGSRPWGRIHQDETFLIKRKYLCLHTIAVRTWDNSEDSGSLLAHSLG